MIEDVIRKKELCKKLIKMDDEIVIVAPAYGDKNQLRIYKNGGLFGKISHRETYINVKSELMTETYAKYCSNEKKLNEFIKKAKNEEDIIETFFNGEYLGLAKEALDNKWKKEKNNNVKKEPKLKERNIETRIMRNFMHTNYDFITIDMEVQCPKEWFNNMTKDAEISFIKEKLKTINKKGEIKEGLTEMPRFDIISFSDDGIGIIELKVDNDNTQNISSHYAHMKHLLNNEKGKKYFLREIKRRIAYLKKYDLVNEKIINKYEKEIFDNQKLWCGFLFIGGKKDDSIKIAKELENYEKINELKFLYCADFDEIDFKKWVNYKDFITGRSFK